MKIEGIINRGTKGLAWIMAFGLLMAPLSVTGAEKVITVGAPLPLTGPLSPEGQKQVQGYDLWAEAANKAGGINVGTNGTR